MQIDSLRKCPYCGYMYEAVLGQNTYSSVFSDPGGRIAVHSVMYVCPHIACNKIEVAIDAGLPPASRKKTDEAVRGDSINSFFKARLLPPEWCGKRGFEASSVPDIVFRDYDEACRLLRASPCASATYARRCLQWMVRKRFRLKPGKFQNEIKALSSMKGMVAAEVIDALERARRVGRLRAMPDDDVKILTDVSYDEARQMIDVIEALLNDWFIAPAEHDRRIDALRAVLESKAAGG